MNITHMARVRDDGRLWPVKTMLKDVMARISKGEYNKEKAIVIFSDTDDWPKIDYIQAGMTRNDIIVLLDQLKYALLKEMVG